MYNAAEVPSKAEKAPTGIFLVASNLIIFYLLNKCFSPPIQTNSKITFLFPFYSDNILQKTANNLGAVSYTYMKEQEFTVLTFQSK